MNPGIIFASYTFSCLMLEPGGGQAASEGVVV
jgi:hypothetical protein